MTQTEAHGLGYMVEDLNEMRRQAAMQLFAWRMQVIREWLDGYEESKIKHLKAQYLDADTLAAMRRVEGFIHGVSV